MAENNNNNNKWSVYSRLRGRTCRRGAAVCFRCCPERQCWLYSAAAAATDTKHNFNINMLSTGNVILRSDQPETHFTLFTNVVFKSIMYLLYAWFLWMCYSIVFIYCVPFCCLLLKFKCWWKALWIVWQCAL